MTALPQSPRGFLLERIRRVLKEIHPGAVFPVFALPLGAHRQITTDLWGPDVTGASSAAGARVRGSLNGGDWWGVDRMPAVDVTPRIGEPDTVTYLSEETYEQTIPLQVVGYVPDPAAGAALNDGGDYDARAYLDAIAADIEVAMQALPYWTGTGPGEDVAAQGRLGSIAVVMTGVATNVYEGSAWHDVELSYRITFVASNFEAPFVQ